MAKKQNEQELLAFKINEDTSDALSITKKSAIETLVMDDISLDDDMVKLVNHLIDKYEPVLKKLADI